MVACFVAAENAGRDNSKKTRVHTKTISILKKPLTISQTPAKQVTTFSKLNGIDGFLVETGTKTTIAFFCTMIRV